MTLGVGNAMEIIADRSSPLTIVLHPHKVRDE